jgi:hypothetical protein
MDISLCWFSVDRSGSFRVTSRPSWVRWLIALVFVAPAASFALWGARQSSVGLPLAAALAVVCPVLAGTGLLLGFSRDEVVIDRELESGFLRRSWRLFHFGRSTRLALPATGAVRATPKPDDGDSGGWWYTVTLDGMPGISFTISEERDRATAFARQLADFLGWPLEDQTAPGGAAQQHGLGTPSPEEKGWP